MSRAKSFVVALLLCVAIAIGVPLAIALIEVLVMHIGGAKTFVFVVSTLLACVAAPFFYVMLRNMK